MKSIPHLESYTFQELEDLYIPLAVHFVDPTYLIAMDEDEAIELEYKRLMELPIYKRAEYDDPMCEGVLPARGIGLEGWNLQACTLVSIALAIYETVVVDDREYAISVFSKKQLTQALGKNIRDIVEDLRQIECNEIRLDVRFQESKVMMIVDRPA